MTSVIEPANPIELDRARPRLRAVANQPQPDAGPLDTGPLDTGPLDFDAAVRRLTPQLQRYATRRLDDPHEAEELVQEALLRAYDHRDQLRTQDDVAAWSTCVTGRLVIDRLRVRNRSTSVAEVPEGTSVGRDTADVVVSKEQARLALEALDAMPARQAAVLWAREVEGLPYGEIGERFGMTEPAVRSVLSRARKALRREFETRGGTLPAAGLVALAPWVDGLSWIERLRRAATRLTAPTLVGVAGLSVLGGVLLAPWSNSPTTNQTTPKPVVVVQSASITRSAVPALPAAPRPTPPAALAARAEAPAAASPTKSLIDRSGLSRTCVEVNGAAAKAGGSKCDDREQTTLFIGPTLPSNPTDVERVGVESNYLECRGLPTIPLTEGTNTTGDQR